MSCLLHDVKNETFSASEDAVLKLLLDCGFICERLTFRWIATKIQSMWLYAHLEKRGQWQLTSECLELLSGMLCSHQNESFVTYACFCFFFSFILFLVVILSPESLRIRIKQSNTTASRGGSIESRSPVEKTATRWLNGHSKMALQIIKICGGHLKTLEILFVVSFSCRSH